jgi:hypothetical protein
MDSRKSVENCLKWQIQGLLLSRLLNDFIERSVLNIKNNFFITLFLLKMLLYTAAVLTSVALLAKYLLWAKSYFTLKPG